MPRLIIVCGPSGTGKSTLLKKLFAEFPTKFGFSVSHTSRKPRAGEEDGVAYHFTPREKLLEMIAQKLFIESAEFSGNIYGTSFDAINKVLQEGKNVVLDIDMQGVVQLQAKVKSEPELFEKQPLIIFLAPPSEEELEKRLLGRGTETADSAQLRLTQAKNELKWGLNPDSGIDHVLVNDDVEKAYEKLKAIILG